MNRRLFFKRKFIHCYKIQKACKGVLIMGMNSYTSFKEENYGAKLIYTPPSIDDGDIDTFKDMKIRFVCSSNMHTIDMLLPKREKTSSVLKKAKR